MTTGDISDGAAPTPASSASAPNGGAAPELRGAGGGAGTAASSSGMKKGPWTAAEDAVLVEYVRTHGEGNWNAVQRNTGLSRCGKSCRLRWANHLRPNLKKGSFSPEEERLILQLHAQMGNKWARMAAQLPGRTDNEIKNYWNTRLKRRHRAGLPLYPPDIQRHDALHRPSTSARVPPSIFDQKLQLSAPVSSSNPCALFNSTNFSRSATAAGTATMDTTVINPFFFGHPRPQFFTPTDDHQKKMKRLRDDMSFTLPSSIDLAQPRPPQASLFQYNPPLGNYDLGPPRPYALQQQSFSLKTELPSSQLYPGPATAGTSHGNVGGQPLEPSNSELWDALLNDDTPHPVCGSSNNAGDGGDRYQREFFIPELVLQDVKWEKASMVNALPAGTEPSPGMTLEPADGWNDSNVSADSTLKTAPAPEMGSMEDELASLLDGIPMATIPTVAAPAAAFREWLTSDSGEDSHGQSSAVTDEVGLDMQQLASSLSMAPEGDHGWSLGPCHWDGTPGVR